MQPEDETPLRTLFEQVRHLSLSVIADDAPVIGLLPFALTPRFDALLVHASNLAQHARGLGSDSPYTALIHTSDTPEIDPLQLPRATVSGHSTHLARASAEYKTGRSRYLTRFPGSEIIFQLGDFHLYRLNIEKVRFVAGFGRAFNVSPARLKDILQA